MKTVEKTTGEFSEIFQKKGHKNMKRTAILLVMILTVAGLSSCGKAGEDKGQTPGETVQAEESAQEDGQESGEESRLPEADRKAEGTSEAEDKEETKENAEADGGLDNFDADMEKVAAYAGAIQEAVADRDLEKLADLTGFPAYVGLEGVDIVETREDFLALDPKAVFSEEMVSSIAKADISGLEPSMAGFTLTGDMGAPSITFGLVNGEFRITGINY